MSWFPMTSAQWAVLVPAVAALATAVAAWLRAQAAHTRLNIQQGQISGIKTAQADASTIVDPPATPPS